MTPAEKVRVRVAMNPPILLVDHSHELALNGTAVVRVEAPSSTKSHAPIDLVTLINISHSMSWPAASPPTTHEAPSTSRLDLLKKAMKFMIKQLDDDDRLAVVAFNDQVVKDHTTGILEMSGGGRVSMERKVDGLVAKGDDGTAFKPSLEYAVKLLDDRADKKRVGFIVLISDGLDKQDKWSDESITPTDPVRALLRKYPVHTLGLCKAHDPKTLHYIAKISYGTYSSIADDDLDGETMEALAVCLAGFKTTVALDACVDIRSSSMQITRIDAGGYTLRGPSGGILIGMLYAGEVKDLVVHFSFRTGGWSRGYYTTLNGITASVTYKDVPGTGRPSTSITDTCSASLPVHTADSSAPPANPCPPHPVALQQMVRSKVVDLLTGVLKEFQVLKEEAGGAVHGKGGDDPVLQAIMASSMQRKWAEFKKSDESWKEAPRSFLDLGGVDRDVDAMVGVLKHGSGVGCVYSWLSRYQMQRATAATGLPAATATGQFRTPAMAAVVREAHRLMAEEASAQDAGRSVVGKRAVELLDGMNKRFELWCKLDHDLPSSGQEEGDLAGGLRGDINRARQHHIYLAADQAIKQWRSFLESVQKTHIHETDK